MTPSHIHAHLLVLNKETSPTACLHLKIIMWEKLSDIQKEIGAISQIEKNNNM